MGGFHFRMAASYIVTRFVWLLTIWEPGRFVVGGVPIYYVPSTVGWAVALSAAQ